MSTIWTPGGEHPVGRAPSGPEAGRAESPPRQGIDAARAVEVPDAPEELEAEVAELRRQLADAPAELVVANHCYALFELGRLHLSLQPPRLPQARIAIDALGALVEGMAGRLGEAEQQLVDALASLRLAYVSVKAAQGGGGAAPPA